MLLLGAITDLRPITRMGQAGMALIEPIWMVFIRDHCWVSIEDDTRWLVVARADVLDQLLLSQPW